jgi:hypothetical protein
MILSSACFDDAQLTRRRMIAIKEFIQIMRQTYFKAMKHKAALPVLAPMPCLHTSTVLMAFLSTSRFRGLIRVNDRLAGHPGRPATRLNSHAGGAGAYLS